EYVTSEMYSAFRVRLLSQAQALPSRVLSRPFLTQESTYLSYVSYGCLHVGFLLLCSLCCKGGGFFILYDWFYFKVQYNSIFEVLKVSITIGNTIQYLYLVINSFNTTVIVWIYYAMLDIR